MPPRQNRRRPVARIGVRELSGLAARSQVDEAGSLASIAALGLPASLVDRLRGSARVWVMTPR